MPYGQASGQGYNNPGVVVANTVEVIGSKGGIFVFSPTVGPGNLIGSWAAQAGTIAGNSYPQGLAIFNHFLTIKDPAQMIFPSGDSMEGTAANLFAAVVGSGATRFLQSLWSGPKGNPVGATDWVQMQLNSAKDDASTDASFNLIYVDTAGGVHGYVAMDSSGFNIRAGSAIATDPSTGTPATPAIPETWHPLGAFSSATWTVNRARYRMTLEGECQIDISLNAQVGGGAAGAFTWANNLLAPYQFTGNFSQAHAMGFNGTITTATNNADLIVDGAGTANPGRVRVQTPALPAATNLSINVRIPVT